MLHTSREDILYYSYIQSWPKITHLVNIKLWCDDHVESSPNTQEQDHWLNRNAEDDGLDESPNTGEDTNIDAVAAAAADTVVTDAPVLHVGVTLRLFALHRCRCAYGDRVIDSILYLDSVDWCAA